MKKSYVKPLAIYEGIQLSASVAGSCSLLGTQSAQYDCPVEDPNLGLFIFAETTFACDTIPPDGNDSVCYDVPFANFNVFSS